MAGLMVTAERGGDYGSIDVWLINPSCGPLHQPPLRPNSEPCTSVLIWSFTFDWERRVEVGDGFNRGLRGRTVRVTR